MNQSDNSTTTPETICISLPALRGVILGVIDDGEEGFRDKQEFVEVVEVWDWDFDDDEVRLRFCDEIERRLRQLPARG